MLFGSAEKAAQPYKQQCVVKTVHTPSQMPQVYLISTGYQLRLTLQLVVLLFLAGLLHHQHTHYCNVEAHTPACTMLNRA